MDVGPSPVRASFRNHLLAALAPDDIARLRPHLSHTTLVVGQVLHERGAPIEDVFFMEAGLASLVADTLDSGAVEVGMTGREGLVGTSALLNPEAVTVHKAFIQIAGAAWRIQAATLRDAVDQSPTLRGCLLRYVQFLMVQTAQSAACNARHDVPARLARWLLLTRDRLDGDELPLRHEFLSLMLGVRRSGVSVAASTLQAGNLIRQARGRIAVLDRPGLEAASCDCYRIVRDSQEQILGSPK